MTGRNSKPKRNGPASRPSQIDQYRDEFPIDMSVLESDPDEENENRKDKTRFTM